MGDSKIYRYVSAGGMLCHLCKEELRMPKTLPCLHVFCRDCIEEYTKAHKNNGSVLCPTCAEKFEVPDNGLVGLRDSTLHKLLLEEIQLFRKNEVKCTCCDKNKIAVAGCPECGAYMCDRCRDAHAWSKTSKEHTVLTIENLFKSHHLRKFQSSRYLPCSTHTGKFKTTLCEADGIMICSLCVYESEHRSHPSGSHVSLVTKGEEARGKVAKLIKEREDHRGALLRSLGAVDIKGKDVSQTKDSIEKRIREEAQKLHKQIDRYAEILLSELKVRCGDTVSSLRSLQLTLQKEVELDQRFTVQAHLVEELPSYNVIDAVKDVSLKDSILPKSSEESLESLNKAFPKIKLVTSNLLQEHLDHCFPALLGFITPIRPRDQRRVDVSAIQDAEEMVDFAKEIVNDALDKYGNLSRIMSEAFPLMSKYLKERMEDKFGPSWHCIVGLLPFVNWWVIREEYIRLNTEGCEICLFRCHDHDVRK